MTTEIVTITDTTAPAAQAALEKAAAILSRGGLVDNAAVGAALEEGKLAVYVTDFPSDEVLSMKNVIPIPHLGASTPESEDNCAVMAAKELIDYLENGNINNSVNFPNCECAKAGVMRITVAHKNVPNMLSQFLSLLQDKNVENMVNKNKGEYAYTIIDTAVEVQDDIVSKLAAIEGVLRVRVIR